MVSEPLPYLFLTIKLSVAEWKITFDSEVYSRGLNGRKNVVYEFISQVGIMLYFHMHNPKMICLETKALHFDSEAAWVL